MIRLSRFLIVLALASLYAIPAHAGMDAMQTIAQLTGIVEVRGNVVRNNKPLECTRWVPAKAGDVLGPGCWVRTGAQSTVRLMRGDGHYHPQKGDTISYTIAQSRTLLLLHGNHSQKQLLEVLRGKIDREEKRI